MHKFTADLILPVASAPLKDAVLIADDQGKILAIEPLQQHDPASVERHHGVLIPGMVNAHCHLELSHMKGKVDTGTGLIPFITGVVTKRAASAEVIQQAIQDADQEMLDNGIVAVGDISNTVDTFAQKSRGRIRYHTFLELFDFLQDENAEKTFEAGRAVLDQIRLAPGSTSSMTPHAPYSVSASLFEKINQFNASGCGIISIHNQETPPENELFEQKTGDFLDFYARFGVSLDAFTPIHKGSIYYALQHLNPANRTLFVHNTLTGSQEIQAAQQWSEHCYWVSCPNANLYIENRLPNYRHFMENGSRVALGTDSLTSNWQLSILEEMKTIARYQRYVPFETLLRWATLNGAEALGYDHDLGSLEVGKKPGILLLEGMDERLNLYQGVTVRRLI